MIGLGTGQGGRAAEKNRSITCQLDPSRPSALAALGRNGVPVYVMYQPGKAPVVVSEILSVEDKREAIVGL